MIKKEILIFLIVGVTTVLVDFLTYRTLLITGLNVDLCKSISFLTGTVFAFFANRKWTFGHQTHENGSAFRFMLLYALTLGLNVLVNTTFLSILYDFSLKITIAFILATGVSAMTNFIGMKFFVFSAKTPTR